MNILKRCMLFLATVSMVLGVSDKAIAATGRLSKSKEEVYLFAVPNGGWSSCRVNIVYSEDYTTNSSLRRNTFNRRVKWYTGVYEYAITSPVLGVGAAVIKSESGSVWGTYTNWNVEPGIFPGNVSVCGSYYNTNSIALDVTSNATGQINYTVTCDGAYNGVRADWVIMRLGTV